MLLPLIALIVLCILGAGYTFYGRFIARQYRLDDATPTPAVRNEDGVDFVPARPFYLLSQHFSAIAAAGPIAGPILACQQFGWLPCLLWITFGVIFIGAVHDFSALVVSVRERAGSIAEIVRGTLGKRSWLSVLLFIWLALLYVIVAFTDITAQTFLGKTEELAGETSFNSGGAVAAAAAIYLALSLLLGVVQRFTRAPLLLLTLIFVPATLGAVAAGGWVSTALVYSHTTWVILILVYCCLASLAPIWLLLQPRGYLGGFVLYLAIGLGLLGVFFGGHEIKQPLVKAAPIAGFAGSVFPFLFVTIACGACSGFHGLVCSGTTSRQVAKESHCHPIGFGAMLLEGFVAVIALSTIMILAPDDPSAQLAPGKIYGNGMAHYMTLIVGEENLRFAATFGAMAFSTFVFDTLDVATRLGRYILQELFGAKGLAGAVVATALTTGLPLLIMLGANENAYTTFWKLFGTSNQLLAALTLLVVTVWLKRSGRRIWFALLPMCFVMAITIWSLLSFCWAGWDSLQTPADGVWRLDWQTLANGAVSLTLIILSGLLLWDSVRALRAPLAARS